MSTSLELSLARGGSARVVESDGDRVVLLATVASPPGSTLEGTAGDGSGIYRVKVRGCRRTENGAAEFRIEGRFVSLSRAQRDAVLSSLARAPGVDHEPPRDP